MLCVCEQNKKAKSLDERSNSVPQEVFLSKQYLWSHSEGIVMNPELDFLSKQVWNKTDHWLLKFSALVHFWESMASSWNHEHWGEEDWYVAGGILGKCASITRVNLVSGSFHESNLAEAKFEIITFYLKNYGNTCQPFCTACIFVTDLWPHSVVLHIIDTWENVADT